MISPSPLRSARNSFQIQHEPSWTYTPCKTMTDKAMQAENLDNVLETIEAPRFLDFTELVKLEGVNKADDVAFELLDEFEMQLEFGGDYIDEEYCKRGSGQIPPIATNSIFSNSPHNPFDQLEDEKTNLHRSGLCILPFCPASTSQTSGLECAMSPDTSACLELLQDIDDILTSITKNRPPQDNCGSCKSPIGLATPKCRLSDAFASPFQPPCTSCNGVCSTAAGLRRAGRVAGFAVTRGGPGEGPGSTPEPVRRWSLRPAASQPWLGRANARAPPAAQASPARPAGALASLPRLARRGQPRRSPGQARPNTGWPETASPPSPRSTAPLLCRPCPDT